jgi:hypothetical protein
MSVSIEIRDDGLYRVQDVFGKFHVSQVFPGWHILFLDEQGVKRMGYVHKVDNDLLTLRIMDALVLNMPILQIPIEIVPWSRVLMAGNGYSRPKHVIYEGKKKIGLREVFMIGEDSTVGFIARKQSEHGRVYVEKRNGVWEVR